MKYEVCRPGRLKVIIAPDEMIELSLSFDLLDYSKIETRRLIFRLLNEAKHETGFKISESCMFIEAIPSSDGGCVLYFTSQDQDNDLIKDKPKNSQYKYTYLYRFKDAETVIRASLLLKKQAFEKYASSDIYEFDGQYILYVYSEIELPENMYAVLEEFGKQGKKNILSKAILNEHGNAIVKETAVETFAKYF